MSETELLAAVSRSGALLSEVRQLACSCQQTIQSPGEMYLECFSRLSILREIHVRADTSQISQEPTTDLAIAAILNIRGDLAETIGVLYSLNFDFALVQELRRLHEILGPDDVIVSRALAKALSICELPPNAVAGVARIAGESDNDARASFESEILAELGALAKESEHDDEIERALSLRIRAQVDRSS